MRAFLSMLLALLVSVPVAAAPVSATDLLVAKAAVEDCALATTAGFLADPPYLAPGCTVGEGSLPTELIVQKCDMSTFLPLIPAPTGNQPWYQRLSALAKGPLDEQARTVLSVHDWQTGDILLSGSYHVQWKSGSSVPKLVALAMANRFEDVPVTVDLYLQGRRISRPIFVKGTGVVGAKGLDADGLEFSYEAL